MPEGDTIRKLAGFLAPALVGHVLTRVQLRGLARRDLGDLRVDGVSSQGKHLYLELEGGVCVRSHLGLHGTWHRYHFGEPWGKPQHQATLVLEAQDWVYVCFNAKEVEVTRCAGFRFRDQRRRVGPDLTREVPQAGLLQARALAVNAFDRPLVDLLLDQRIACGIGNVYKSEVLFLTRRAPLQSLGELAVRDFDEIYGLAAQLLQRNLAGGPRVTREIPDGRGLLWVYGRAGLPCLICGTPLRWGRLGAYSRSTYWCPACQAPSGA